MRKDVDILLWGGKITTTTQGRSLQVSVASLEPHEKSGWLTKQGGSIKTWKRRWGVLQGYTLWYFKTKNDTDAKGFIILDKHSQVHDENKRRRNMISVEGRGVKGVRPFFIYFDTPAETQEWITALQNAISAAPDMGNTVAAAAQNPDTLCLCFFFSLLTPSVFSPPFCVFFFFLTFFTFLLLL